MGHFLADGIYHECRIFVRPIQDAPAGPQTDYTKAQEGVQKGHRVSLRCPAGEILFSAPRVRDVEGGGSSALVQGLRDTASSSQSYATDRGFRSCDSRGGSQYDLINQFMCEETIRLQKHGEKLRTGTVTRLLPNGGGTPALDIQRSVADMQVVQTMNTDRTEHRAMWVEMVGMCAIVRRPGESSGT